MKTQSLFFIFLLLFFVGCGKKGGSESPVEISGSGENQRVEYTEEEKGYASELKLCSSLWDEEKVQKEKRPIAFGVMLYDCLKMKELNVKEAGFLYTEFENKKQGKTIDFNQLAKSLLKGKKS
ncbi:hypothetical protein DOM21_10840 [Bacteriovorax stolpii]|uniref:Uncharacterized protein n=1 Tax=Bacteriovorax stolpii TaxID=960 RepID=A0A2K9NRF1_BACTC|nr:hypothetical protein [Bacteriovorax stolpii]AUN98087.1 hypothetical protein C0V70_08185 [Bacteriovorax stolpii]QDK41933.1 hypothetical protein DOM21_10840 [Bacteriovorax stolpii]TDP52001.1 hypothetical protein C8D79_2647 [Bacteriovorax stolpii]